MAETKYIEMSEDVMRPKSNTNKQTNATAVWIIKLE